jgi:hypothetical protein
MKPPPMQRNVVARLVLEKTQYESAPARPAKMKQIMSPTVVLSH